MAKKKTLVVIRNMDDVINFQILRWKSKYPDAAQPDEWSDNEIKPDERFDESKEISEEAEAVILEDDKYWAGSSAGGGGKKRKGTYEKGYRDHDAAFVKRAQKDHKEHYDAALMESLEELEKEYGDEYEIVYEGEYAQRLMAAREKTEEGKRKPSEEETLSEVEGHLIEDENKIQQKTFETTCKVGNGRINLIYGVAMGQDKKTIQVTEEQKELLYAAMMHVGGGFERRLDSKLPVSYQYTKPGQVPTFKKKLMVDLTEYESVCNDLADVPTGMTKFTHWDRSRDFVQDKIIDKIKNDQGSNHTFLLYTRPRIEALGLTTFRLRVEGIWVKEKNVKQINAPEDLEEPFPFE